MKYSLELGPMVGSTVNWIWAVVATLTLVWTLWSWVCWLTFPAKIPTMAIPNCCRLGVLPSSFQAIVHCWPPVQVVLATGEVMETVAYAFWTRAATAMTKRFADTIFFNVVLKNSKKFGDGVKLVNRTKIEVFKGVARVG